MVLALVSAATFNLSKFPGFRGHDLLRRVQRRQRHPQGQHGPGRRDPGRPGHRRHPGRRPGPGEVRGRRRRRLRPGQPGVDRGLNLLGEKYLELTPAGDGQIEDGDTIPVERTEAAYDIVERAGRPDHHHRGASTPSSSPRRSTWWPARWTTPLPRSRRPSTASRGSPQSVASRDEQIQTLLRELAEVTKVLERAQRRHRRPDAATATWSSRSCRSASRPCTPCSSTPGRWPIELEGVAKDNEEQIGPALAEVDELLGVLVDKRGPAQGDAAPARPLRRDPQQHHRHRPLVRRHGDQPRDLRSSCAPGARVRLRESGSDDDMIDFLKGLERRVVLLVVVLLGLAAILTVRGTPNGDARRSPRTSRAPSASTRAPRCGSSASTSARSPR